MEYVPFDTIPCEPPDFDDESPESDRLPIEYVALNHIPEED